MRQHPEHFRDDGGFALPAAMSAVIAVTAIIGVLFTTAIVEQRATRVSQDFENAIHAAEAGLDSTISILNEDNTYANDGLVGRSLVAMPAPMTPAEERQWAIDAASASSPAERVFSANGWAYGFRPVDPTGVPTDFLYGVGVITEGPYAEQTRVLKVRFDTGYFRPEHAVLSDGDLRIESPTTVGGPAGRVHTNEGLTLDSSPTVEQGATYVDGASGTARDTTGTPQVPVGTDPVAVPEISAISFYESRLRPETSGTWFADGLTPSASGKDPFTYDGDWFDMCIQLGQTTATVRVPADDGQAPCSGAVYRILQRTGCGGALELNPGDAGYPQNNSLFRGWHAHDDYWHICHEFPEDAGVFFLNGGAGRDTKIGVKDATHSSRITIISDHGLTMDDEMHLEPWLEGYLLQAEGSMEIKGEHNLTGGIASRECITIEGKDGGTVINGSIISNNEGGCTTTIKKDVTINYDGGLSLPLGGIVRISAWNELFGG